MSNLALFVLFMAGFAIGSFVATICWLTFDTKDWDDDED